MDIETVDKFLKEFKDKARVFGIIFRIDRKKNMQALLDLEISAIMREKIIMSLTVEDYYKGPTEDKLNYMGELWKFGKSVDKKEVYIKISKGTGANSPICVSFHLAERKIEHPFKNNLSSTYKCNFLGADNKQSKHLFFREERETMSPFLSL